MKIVEIAFTGYPVTDIQRARAFYEDVLKLESTRTFESGDRHWTEYDLGPSTFAISNMSSEDWKPSNDGPAIAFEVEDFDSAVARLRANDDIRYRLRGTSADGLQRNDDLCACSVCCRRDLREMANTVCTKVLGPASLSSIMSEAEKYAFVTTKRNTYD